MIDFNTSQLTWIVIGACSIGGTGYITMDKQIQEITTKLEVTNKQMEHNNNQLEKLIVKMEDLNKILADNRRK